MKPAWYIADLPNLPHRHKINGIYRRIQTFLKFKFQYCIYNFLTVRSETAMLSDW